ncbi:phytanoyl-CoA dioxygenase family protein [Pseudomonas sp. nanlin1]|uniref:phytanoyl-CoA dioxygenase family protein n=1 Tax=Pseudomonas sp. nanlin1 TaxID=3040605 RepID=UPI00388FF7C9
MLSKYRVMRGLFKRRLPRVMAWKCLAFVNRNRMAVFIDRQMSRASESYTAFDRQAIEHVVAELEQDGAVTGPFLPAPQVKYLRQYAESNPCFADRDQGKGFFLKDREKAEALLGKNLLLAQYFNVDADPEIHRLANDPFLLAVAARYLGVEPKLMSINMWWTFPVLASEADREKHAHVYHFDLDDLKFVKFFFYLTDVGAEDGPHVYVKSSNRIIKYENNFFKSKRFTDKEIEDAYGEENIISVIGPAGSCLIEDTITVHKGLTPVGQPRLILQFEYAINTYPEISCVADVADQKIIV